MLYTEIIRKPSPDDVYVRLTLSEHEYQRIMNYPTQVCFVDGKNKNREKDLGEQLSEIIDESIRTLEVARRELKNYFTLEEASLITKSMDGLLPIQDFNKQEVLISQLLTNDKTVISDKIMKLTEFQCYVTISNAYLVCRDKSNRGFKEKVKKYFFIEE